MLDVSWADGKEPDEPVYVTVSDPSFTDGDGLAVYSYAEDDAAGAGQWEEIGTYAIRDQAVTFQAKDMAALAFAVLVLSYMKLATGSFNPFIYSRF